MTWLKVLAMVLLLGGAYYFGYDTAQTKADLAFTEFKLESEKQYSELLEKSTLWERTYQSKLQEIEANRLFSLVEQKQKYENLIADLRADNLSGVSERHSAGEDGGKAPLNSSRNLVCYTRDDLLARVKATLALGARADKLATDYNTLLKIIEAYHREEKGSKSFR